RVPSRPYVHAENGDVYGKERVGWSTMTKMLQRDNRALSIDDVLRVQHLLGQKSHKSGRARCQVVLGIAVGRAAIAEVPTLVIGGGLDRLVPEPGSERLADWLGALYEPFGAHSHFGLVVGEHSFVQVADTIRGFLDAHRL